MLPCCGRREIRWQRLPRIPLRTPDHVEHTGSLAFAGPDGGLLEQRVQAQLLLPAGVELRTRAHAHAQLQDTLEYGVKLLGELDGRPAHVRRSEVERRILHPLSIIAGDASPALGGHGRRGKTTRVGSSESERGPAHGR